MGESSVFIPPDPSAAFRPVNNKALPGRSEVAQDNPATYLFQINWSDRQWHLHYLSHSALPGPQHEGTCREDLRSYRKAEKTRPRLPFAPHRHTAGTKMLHCTGEDDKGPGSSWLKLNPNSETRCYSAKESGLEKAPATMPSFSPKWACSLQSSLLGPGGGTACDVLATLPTAFLAGNEQLFVAGREPMSFSSLPRSHQTLNLHTTTSLRPRPVQTMHSATSQDAGPQRANAIIPTWGHRHHSCCFQTSRARGQKQEKVVWWVFYNGTSWSVQGGIRPWVYPRGEG